MAAEVRYIDRAETRPQKQQRCVGTRSDEEETEARYQNSDIIRSRSSCSGCAVAKEKLHVWSGGRRSLVGGGRRRRGAVTVLLNPALWSCVTQSPNEQTTPAQQQAVGQREGQDL